MKKEDLKEKKRDGSCRKISGQISKNRVKKSHRSIVSGKGEYDDIS